MILKMRNKGKYILTLQNSERTITEDFIVRD